MLSNGWEIILLFMTLSMSLRAIQLQIELDQIKKSDTESSTDKKNDKNKSPKYNDGDWMVKLRKPKTEMVIAGCNTEGEVVRQIILLGHQPSEVKEITRL